jgi:predicted dehydrogenase
MVKSAIIGLGKMGLSHCSIINAHPYLDLIAVCDTSSLVLEAIKKYSGINTYSDYKKMIDTNELQAIFIATPTKFHADMVMYALERKIHVFCEKPFSLRTEQGQAMVELAGLNKCINQVGYHNRFVATFNYVKKLIEKKIIGDIYHFTGEAYGPVVINKKGGTWRSDSAEGGGCLFDYASHVLNLIEYVLDNIKSVGGVQLKKVYSKDVEDAVYASLFLENDLSGQLSVNWSDETYRKMSTQVTILGTKGKIISDAQEIKIFMKEKNADYGLDTGWNSKYITDLESGVNFYLRGEEYSAQIDYFANCIKENRTTNRNSFKTAFQTDLVIDRLKMSAI